MYNGKKYDFSFFIFLFYFIFLLVIAFFVRDVAGQADIWSTIAKFDPLGLGDPLSFASGAMDLYRNGWFTQPSYGLIHLWPPGFMLFEGGILKLFGENAPFIMILAIAAAFLGALLLLILRRYLIGLVPPIVATALPLLPFCFPVTRLFLLEPIGLVLGEGFSVIFFLMTVVLVLLALRENSWKKALAAGLFLALAAYFRSQYELIVLFLTLFAIPIIAYMWLKRYKRNVISIILLTLVTAHVLMLPWRIYNFISVQSFSWVFTQGLVTQSALVPEKQLHETGATYRVEGGGHLACALESAYCGKTDSKLFYRAFFKHMGAWYQYKLAAIGSYWFSPVHYFVSTVSAEITRTDKFVNGLFLLCVLLTLPLLWFTRHAAEAMLYLWICLSFYACFFVIFSIVHFEVRYFYLMKIFAVFSTLMLGSLKYHLWKQDKRKRA